MVGGVVVAVRRRGVGWVLLGGHGIRIVMRVHVALAAGGPRPDRRVAQVAGPGQPPARTSAIAALMPRYAAFDFGASARWTTAWARMIRASGMPIWATACIAATAVSSAVGSAMPTSSLAQRSPCAAR